LLRSIASYLVAPRRQAQRGVMLTLIRNAAVAAVLLIAAPAFAQTDVTGWWRADIEQGGETEPLYFRFGPNAEGAARLRLSIPVTRMYEIPGGAYEVTGNQLTLVHLGPVSFQLSEDGQSFAGVFPGGFITPTGFPVQFVRAEEPEPPAPITPLGAAPSPAWTVSIGGPIWAGLTHDSSRALYVARADGVVIAMSPRTGAEIWRADLASPARSTPTLRGRRLYVATDAGLVALDARSGRQVWSAPLGQERAPRLPISDQHSKWDHYSSSPAVDDHLVVVGSRDGCVYALDARTGAQRWRSCTEDIVTATPVLTRDVVYYAGYDGRVYAVSRADGRELWRYDSQEAIPRDVTLAGDNVIVGSRSYDLIALNARTGAPAWTRHVWYSWIDSPAVLVDGRLYFGTSDAMNVFAIDAQTGARVWAAPVPGWTWPRVAVGRETVYASVVGGNYSAPRAAGFAAIDRDTGALRWLYEAPRPEGAEVYGFAASPVVAGRRVFTADLAGNVYAFDD
jgi:eukaryotic-like serine/threonine-protein kinase